MSNRNVIITGPTRGIGKTIAFGFAEENDNLVLLGRNEEKLNNLKNELEEKNDKIDISIYVSDFADHSKLESALEKINSDFTKIDVLVNNAGVYEPGSIDADIDTFKKVLDINLSAPYLILKAIAPKMQKQKSGYIFNIASRAGKVGFEKSGTYSSSKFGLVGLSEALYRLLAKDEVKVTTICPGWVYTDMAFEAGTPIEGKDMIQPEDIMNTINYLLNLTSKTIIKEIIIECNKSIET